MVGSLNWSPIQAIENNYQNELVTLGAVQTKQDVQMHAVCIHRQGIQSEEDLYLSRVRGFR